MKWENKQIVRDAIATTDADTDTGAVADTDTDTDTDPDTPAAIACRNVENIGGHV